MIIAAWKPKIKTIKGKETLIYFEKVDIEEIQRRKPKGWVIVCKCTLCDKIINFRTSVIFREDCTFTDMEFQYCRSCRSKLSEKCKDSAISFDDFKEKLESEGYKVYSTNKEEFENNYRSQVKVDVECKNGHRHFVTWNNFSKGKRCKKCYEENKLKNSLKNIEGFEVYKRTVLYYTKLTTKNIKIENIEKRSRDWHLDHKFSIYEGFKNNVPSYIMGSYYNLEMIEGINNNKKYTNCSITKEQLFEQYFKGEYKWN